MYFGWCLKLKEAWRAEQEPVRERDLLAINNTALSNGFGVLYTVNGVS